MNVASSLWKDLPGDLTASASLQCFKSCMNRSYLDRERCDGRIFVLLFVLPLLPVFWAPVRFVPLVGSKWLNKSKKY